MDLTGPELERWAPRTPEEVARLLEGLDATWYVLTGSATGARPKDEDDLRAALPHLDRDRRAWLAGAFDPVHPSRRWLGELRGDGATA